MITHYINTVKTACHMVIGEQPPPCAEAGKSPSEKRTRAQRTRVGESCPERMEGRPLPLEHPDGAGRGGHGIRWAHRRVMGGLSQGARDPICIQDDATGSVRKD